MSWVEWGIVVAVMGLIVGGALFVRPGQPEASWLAADLAAVQAVALAQARARCAHPPTGAVALDTILRTLNRTAAVRDPAAWSIRLSPSAGSGGVVALIRHAVTEHSTTARTLLQEPGARWIAGCCVELPAGRPTIGAQRSSFQFLFDGDTC